jgi:GntR family transcriptional regulator
LVGVELPKARQVYLALRAHIAGGPLDAGAPLPGEQSLAAEHHVARMTVRRALAELEREGLIDRRRGAGTFVAARRPARPMVADFADALGSLIEMGRSTDVRLLAFGYQQPPAAVAEALGLAAGEPAQRSVRVRIIDGEPFSHLTAHVPESIGRTYSERDLAAEPLLALLERSGVAVDRGSQEIGAVLAAPEVAAALEIAVGSALIALTRVVYDAQGRGVEHLRALYRPDRYALRIELLRTGVDGGRRWTTSARGEAAPKSSIDDESTGRAADARRQKGKRS